SRGSTSCVSEPGDDVVDGITDRLQAFEVLVLDLEAWTVVSEALLDRLGELVEVQGAQVEVLRERVALGDAPGVDLEDLRKFLADEVEHLGPAELSLGCVRLGRHDGCGSP